MLYYKSIMQIMPAIVALLEFMKGAVEWQQLIVSKRKKKENIK